MLPFVNDYLTNLADKGYSAWRISTAKAALSKLFQVPSSNFIETPTRKRQDIKRGRDTKKSSERIAEETKEIVEFF